MIHFNEDDRQMIGHAASEMRDQMLTRGGYDEADYVTVNKLDALSEGSLPAVVVTGEELSGGPEDPQVQQMFQDVVKAELANWVPGASQRLLYRVGLILDVPQPNPRKGLRDCGPEAGHHALFATWVAGLYVQRCCNCFRLYEG